MLVHEVLTLPQIPGVIFSNGSLCCISWFFNGMLQEAAKDNMPSIAVLLRCCAAVLLLQLNATYKFNSLT